MKKERTAPMIQVGASVEAVKSARQAIIDILKLPYVDNKVKAQALRTFEKVCAVNGTSISNCNLQG